MKVTLTANGCTLTREPGDKRLNSEKSVTHAMRTILAEQGVMSYRQRGFGGHLLAQTLRLPKLKACLWHERYQIELAHLEFNNTGYVFYQRVDDDQRTEFEHEVIDYPLRAELAATK
jgi:hypothetical protein